MRSLWAGAAVAAARLKKPAAAVGPTLALLFVIVAALLERQVSPSRASDHALAGAVFGLALPLLACSTMSWVTGRARLDAALVQLARHGGNRRLGAFGLLAATALWMAPVGALLAGVAILITRGPGDPWFAGDLLTSAWLGGLGGVAYACWFALGSMFGSAGGGRTFALLVDWILGSGATALAVPWPRGHLRNLLGAEPVMAMPQWSALAALAGLAVVYAALAVWRNAR